MESVNSTAQGTIGDQKPPIRIFVDGEEITTTERELTANEVIRKFGEKDPSTNYLVEIEGNHKISFQGKGNEEIKLHNNLHFQIVSTGPTPVSFANGPTV